MRPDPGGGSNAFLRIGTTTNGFYVLDDVVNAQSLTATYGRTNTSEQPSPSVFSCTVTLPFDNYDYQFNLNDVVEWKVLNSTGLGKTLAFYGTVTDVTQSITYWSNGKGLIDYTITAMGPLLRLQRYYVNTAFAKQYEGDRIYSICSLVGANTSLIETPGSYEVAAVTSAYGPGLGYAQTAAQSGMGILYEDYDKVRYETYATRSARSIAFTLDGTKVEAMGLVSNTSTADIVNRVSVTYGTSAASSTEYVDTNSQTLYGPLTGVRATELHNLTDANTQAQQLLKARAYPYPQVTQVVINLENPNLTLNNRGNLLLVRVGQRCKITVPRALGNDIDGFIEGYTWSYQNRQRILTLNISSYTQNVPYTVWYNVNAADTWNTYATATTKWSDIT